MTSDLLHPYYDEVTRLNVEKGWHSLDTTFGEHIALAHSELSEALDAFRIRKLEAYTTPGGKPDDVGSELADVFIRLLDICGIYGIDLLAEYRRKMDYNWTRPYRHGGKIL